MHLTIFGATGGTGRALLRHALDAGHDVTALARNPTAVTADHERLRTLQGDVLDAAAVTMAVDGADAVLSALGATSGRAPTTVYSSGMVNILAGMRTAGVRRLVALTAAPVAPRSEAGVVERVLIYPILYRFFGAHYADMGRMEELLRRSDVDWTVLRPPRLTDKPGTGRYRIGVDKRLQGARTVTRADLADAMLQLVDDRDSVRAIVAVAN